MSAHSSRTPPYILALDQGTTSSRALVFDADARCIAVAQREFEQHFPQPGWVEHDADEIWISQLGVAREALARAGLNAEDIAAIGIANQRETTLVWDRASGRPVAPAIVWQDRRTAPLCQRLREEGLENLFNQFTGLLLDPYFSGTKLRWLLDNIPQGQARAESGQLAFGTIDSWLVWKLTAGRLHVTDASNASRTLLYNIHRSEWDPVLCDALRIPQAILPRVLPSSHPVGHTDAGVFGVPLLIGGMAGDQQAALFGQSCLDAGMAKNTYGTGCFMLLHTGDMPCKSKHGLLTTRAAQLGATAQYALEGSVFSGGAVVQWLRDGLGIIKQSSDIEALAASVPDAGGVYLVPAFTGLGAPYWDPDARGAILGLSRGSSAAHLARAALESIAFQSAELLAAMQADSASPLKELRVDGGATSNKLLLQMQADLLGIPVLRPAVQETTALGAAYLAGLAAGIWDSPDAIRQRWRLEQVFEPAISRDRADYLMTGWRNAVRNVLSGFHW
ncbi:glycerol kinase GlpK [Uliginosibacterium sp. H1]|uniref:glycerol kinase GlpK n=1 Tax=Uliginosibacterium sp. H1 TaxID=3114757 RepID=UPI002E19F492|nr:glycerol kinase GlpK [Uliginosibacterium sp. H1]